MSRPAAIVTASDSGIGLARLPDAAVLEAWDGSAVVLPYLAGRSTTRCDAGGDHPWH